MTSYAASLRVKLNSLVAVAAALALIGVLTPPEAIAQVGGANVGGVVTDETGAVIPNASVVIKNKATDFDRRLVTGVDEIGRAHV